MKLTIARILYVLIGITLVFAFSGCKTSETEAASITVGVTPPSNSNPPPNNNTPVNNPPQAPSTDMTYTVSWDNTYNAEGVSFVLDHHVANNANYKRIDIYKDASCLQLVNIVTPASLETSAVSWAIQRGIDSYVSVVETDINDVAGSCKNIASTQMISDVIAPTAPTNFHVHYSWANASTLSVSSDWTASTDNVSVVRYYIYASADPTNYDNPLASTSTTGNFKNFSFVITDPNAFFGSSVFIHIVAEDQDGNLSQAITDSGYYIDTVAPVLNAQATYLDRGVTGIALNVSGTCEAGIPVALTYSSNMSAFSGLLANSAACDNGTFTYSFPVLFAWYADNMVITARQTDSSSNITSFPINLVSSSVLGSVLQ